MRTRNPISTISYNSDDFLSRKLNDLIAVGDLQFWAFINHRAEESEKRDHKHVFILPDGMFDTNKFIGTFDELHEDGSVDGCKLFQPSKWGDWYYYALHDPAYLACKYDNEKPKKFRYWPDQVITSDPDIRAHLMETIKYTELMSPGFKVIRDHALAGVPIHRFLDIFPVKKSDLRFIKEVYELYGGMWNENSSRLSEETVHK